MAEKAGVSRMVISEAAKAGLIPGAKKVGQYWHIPEDTVYPLKAKTPVVENAEGNIRYVSATNKAENWEIAQSPVYRYCREGRIPGAERVGGKWHILEDTEKPTDKRTSRKPGYVSAGNMAKKWEIALSTVCRCCRGGRIPGAELIDGKWHIPENAVKPEDRRGKRK